MKTTNTLDPHTLAESYRAQHMCLSDYLEAMMEDYDAQSAQGLFLPSLLSLSSCFQCSAAEVHLTLNELKRKGCDFFIMDFNTPITLWYPKRLKQ